MTPTWADHALRGSESGAREPEQLTRRSSGALRRGFLVGLAMSAVGLMLTACSSTSTSSTTTPSPSAVAAAPSPGCTSKGAEVIPNGGTLTYSANGITGTYIIDLPPETHQPTPLVFDLHGYLEPAAFEHMGTGLSAFGDAHGFITITPQISSSSPPAWDYGPHSQDVAWLGSLLSSLEQSTCIDERRLYSAGLSMGAFMTSSLACQLSDRIAAVAPVAGLQDYPWCKPTRPVPVVAFQGTADPFVAYGGGPGPHAKALPATDGSGLTVGQELKAGKIPASASPLQRSIPSQVASWAQRNGCSSPPSRTHIGTDVVRSIYPCPADASVDFYTVLGGGHTWPGGVPNVYPVASVGRMTTTISANEIMWSFFQAHPLTGPVSGPVGS